MKSVPRKRRRIGPWAIVLIALGSLCGLSMIVGGVIGYSVLDVSAARDLPNIAERFRAAGYPWVAADLARKHALPPNQDAGVILRSLYADLDSADLSKAANEISDELAKGSYDEAASTLASHEVELSQVVAASQLQGADWKRDNDLGPLVLFTEASPTKGFVKLLCYKAELDAHKGRIAECTTSLRAARKLGRFIAPDGYLIGMLVHISCDAIVDRSVQNCAAVFSSNSSALGKLADLDYTAVNRADFVDALRQESYMGVATTRNLDYWGWQALLHQYDMNSDSKVEPLRPIPSNKLRRNGYPDSIVCRGIMATVLNDWIKLAPTLNKPGEDPRKVGQAMDDIAVEGSKHKFSIGDIVASEMFPVFKAGSEAVVKDEADAKCTLALVKSLAYKARTGHFPTTLAAIGGVWMDPFTKAPLKIRNADGKFRVYSLGPHTKDFGGLVRAELTTGSSTESYNIAAVYPPIPRKVSPKQFPGGPPAGFPGGPGASGGA